MRMNDFDSYMKQNIRPVSPSEAFDAKIRETLNTLPFESRKEGVRRRRWVLVLNAVVLAMIVIFLLPSGEVLLSTEWLHEHPSKNEQQYVIEGIVFEPEFIERADADNPQSLRTSSYEEFSAFLECDLRIPQTMLSSWTIKEYGCLNSFPGMTISAIYHNPEIKQAVLVYNMSWIMNPEEDISVFEQIVHDGEGWFEDVADHRVLVQKLDPVGNGYWFQWIDGNCKFGLYGPLSLHELSVAASELMDVFDSLSVEVQDKWIPEESIEPVSTLQADNAQEIRNYLGTDFVLPMVQIDGWKPVDYYGVLDRENGREALIFYEQEDGGEGTIIVEKKVYTKFEDVYESYEQNEMGEIIQYGDLEIYVSYNYDYILTICLQDNCLYVVTGAIDLDEAKQIYDQLLALENENTN